MKKLQETLIDAIDKVINDPDGVDPELLDALDRALGTVSNYLVATGQWKEN